MAVGYTSDTDKTPATGSSFTYTSFVVSGTNPVIVVLIGLNSTTATVSSVAVSAGLPSGTPVEIAAVRNTQGANGTYVSIWVLPAPSGTGTITVTLSASVAWQSTAILLSGADQTTPGQAGDTVSATGDTPDPLVVTPANLTANDASVGLGANASAGDDPQFGGTGAVQTFYNNGTSINASGGYKLGTGSINCNWGVPAPESLLVGARIIAATAGGAAVLRSGGLLMLGVG